MNGPQGNKAEDQKIWPCAGCDEPNAPWRDLTETFYCHRCIEEDRRAEHAAQIRHDDRRVRGYLGSTPWGEIDDSP